MKPDHLQVLYDTIKGYPETNFFATKYEFFRKNKIFPSTISRLQEGFYGIDLVLKGNPFACHFCIRKNQFIPPLHPGGEGVPPIKGGMGGVPPDTNIVEYINPRFVTNDDI